MNAVNAIYGLEKIGDNPKYEGFGMGDRPSLLGRKDRYEDLSAQLDSTTAEWIQTTLAQTWEPLPVVGRVRPYNDFPCLGLTKPVFSQRAVDVLADVLKPNGELLPLVSSVGNYYLFNCTTIADIVDERNSILEYMNKYTILEFDHLSVFEDRLDGLSVFQMRKYPNRCFVTDSVARRVRKAKLEGFDFRKIWPLPRDILWWRHKKHPECHDELTMQPELAAETRPIKGNAVVMRLGLAGENPSRDEQARFEDIADRLDTMLVSKRKGDRHYGNLEINEFVPWEGRYFFSCPDADELAKKLKPWVKSLDWPGKKWLTKRYGSFVDSEASEEPVNI